MKNILGHRSWSEQEILAFFDAETFTMCSLPHYRYQRVQSVCGKLKRCGLIERTGSTETGVSYVAKPEYHQWRRDVAEGKATGSLDKLFKLQHPPKLLKKTCPHCHVKFETYNRQQKYHTAECNRLARIAAASGKNAA